MKEGGVMRINEYNGAYDPLHYVLMFPYGEDGYHLHIPYANIKQVDPSSYNNDEIAKQKFVTAKEFYSYQIMTRKDNGQWIYGRLTQQYFTDMWAKIECQRLLYIRLNQKQLRSDLYKGMIYHYFS